MGRIVPPPRRHTITLPDEATERLAKARFAELRETLGFAVSWSAFLGGLVRSGLAATKPQKRYPPKIVGGG